MNFYSICAQYLLGEAYHGKAEYDIDRACLISTLEFPAMWVKLLKVEQICTGDTYILKGPQYFGWIIAKMAVKAALETNDLAFLEIATREFILPYEKPFFEDLKQRYPDDVVDYSTASLIKDGLCYARTSLFVGKIGDYRTVITPGIVAGVEGNRQYVEISFTSPTLWDYYFDTQQFTVQDVLADSTYNSYRNLLLISLKA